MAEKKELTVEEKKAIIFELLEFGFTVSVAMIVLHFIGQWMEKFEGKGVTKEAILSVVLVNAGIFATGYLYDKVKTKQREKQ